MAISVNTNFTCNTGLPLDSRQYLSFDEMLTINENIYPDKFFAIGKENGNIYLYNVENEIDEVTGKFREMKATVEEEDETIDFSLWDEFEPDTLETKGLTVDGLLLISDNPFELDVGEKEDSDALTLLVKESKEYSIIDSDLRKDIRKLQDVLIPGEGIEILDDGTIKLLEE